MRRRRTKRRARRRDRRVFLILAGMTAAALLLFGVRLAAEHFRAPEKTPAPSAAPTLTFSAGRLPSPTPSPAPPSPSPTPDGLSVSGGTATVAWLSDTQHYPERAPEVLQAMTRFLRDERARMNLLYVVHTGDFVDDRASASQWAASAEAMAYLDGIPYGVLAGNHDVGTSEQDFGFYGKYLGEKAMRARSGGDAYYGGSYQNNRGHYDLIDLNGDRFVFVYMSYGPDADAVSWINGIFKKYRDRVGVLCVHDYFKTDMTYSDPGKTLLKKVVKKNSNLYLVLCGHRYTVGMLPLDLDDDGDGRADRRVYQMIQNYQAAGDLGGDGYLQFLQFDGEKRELRVVSYSPFANDRRYHDKPGAALEKYPVDPNNEEYRFPYPWG